MVVHVGKKSALVICTSGAAHMCITAQALVLEIWRLLHSRVNLYNTWTNEGRRK